MNNTKTTVIQALKLQKYTFFELIDKKSTFLAIQQKLSDFCKQWRENHCRGGITANHRELVWALLKILPASLEWQREKQPRRFAHALKFGRYKIVTNRKTIAKKMLDCRQFCTQYDLPSSRTITNLLNRLIEAGVLLYKRTEKAQYNSECKAMLIEFNPDLIKLFKVQEELTEAGEGSSDQNPTIAATDQLQLFNPTIAPADQEEQQEQQPTPPPAGEAASDQQPMQFLQNWIKAAQTVAEQEQKKERLTKSGNNEQQYNTGQKNLLIGKTLQHYTTNLNRTIKEKEKRKDKALTNVNNFYSVTEFKQSRQNKELSLELLLLRQFFSQLYQNKFPPADQEQLCLQLIGQHLKAAAAFVQSWRGYCIRKAKSSPKFEAAKNKDLFLKNVAKLLPDVEKTAFQIVSNAINIQAEYIERKQYNFFVAPAKYLSEKFLIPLGYAKDQCKLNWQHPLNNSFIVAQSKLNSQLWKAVANISFVFKKEGSQRALQAYQKEYKELTALINSPDCNELTAAKKEIYLQRLQQQLQHLFKNQ